jgi:UrcA family protein
MSTRTRLSILTLIACSLACGSALAVAAADDIPTVTVSYADLDLSKPAGAQTLYRRIEDAARTVCGPLASRELRRRRLWRDCYEQAVEDAVATADQAILTAMTDAARTRRS